VVDEALVDLVDDPGRRSEHHHLTSCSAKRLLSSSMINLVSGFMTLRWCWRRVKRRTTNQLKRRRELRRTDFKQQHTETKSNQPDQLLELIDGMLQIDVESSWAVSLIPIVTLLVIGEDLENSWQEIRQTASKREGIVVGEERRILGEFGVWFTIFLLPLSLSLSLWVTVTSKLKRQPPSHYSPTRQVPCTAHGPSCSQ
jgi:hypothetical protein